MVVACASHSLDWSFIVLSVTEFDVVIPGLTGYLVLCLWCLGWYLRNAIVVGTFASGIERMLCVFRLSVNVSGARASHFASLDGCLCPPLSRTSLCAMPGLTGYLCCYA